MLVESKETAEIPVIMLTARGQDRDREAGRIAGAREFLVKPFSPKVLRELVEHKLFPEANAA